MVTVGLIDMKVNLTRIGIKTGLAMSLKRLVLVKL